MVNNSTIRRILESDCEISIEPDDTGNDRRIIANGPVYVLPTVQAQLQTRGLKFVTAKAAADKFTFDMGTANLVPFMRALKDEDHYRKSERCQTSESLTPPIPWDVDCDAYAMRWNRYYKREFSDGKEFYLKYGFSDNAPECLIISIHD